MGHSETESLEIAPGPLVPLLCPLLVGWLLTLWAGGEHFLWRGPLQRAVTRLVGGFLLNVSLSTLASPCQALIRARLGPNQPPKWPPSHPHPSVPSLCY